MSDTSHNVVVLGASTNPFRYSNVAVRSLVEHGFRVTAIGNRPGEIDGTAIIAGMPAIEDVYAVTLYLGAVRQEAYHDYILALKPKRIVFNPGAENPELVRLARANNIEAVMGCTLIMLSNGTF